MRIEKLTIREVLRSARELMEMSQTDLAKHLGVTSAYVSMLESGRRHARVRYQKDVYWRLACLVGDAAPGGRLAFYADMVAIDLLEREPAVFELLGGFFYKEVRYDQNRGLLSMKEGVGRRVLMSVSGGAQREAGRISV
ncbi:MAG: helix-turn-helix transcriptional regulator [Desulfuromonadales bacterium]|nr:helix-turn-helix transcriptional regulator [Desulfuromonadales bacterium]